jgi:hypothetical protein
MAAALGAASSARATTTFADFNDTANNQWVYTNGTLTASTATANFLSFGAPNQILNYSGPVTYDLRAVATGPATNAGGVLSQVMNGELIFRHGSVVVLDVAFSGSLLSGLQNSNSTHLTADTQITGNIISYTADPSVQVNQIVEPLSFSIALTQIPGITINGSNLNNFTATASGSFASNIGAGTGAPEPASLSVLALGGLALLRRRRSAR